MTDRNLTNVWCWSPNPPPSVTNAWQAECWANGSHIVVHAATQQAVQDKLYLDHPELRGIVHWVFEAPKPKRLDDPKPAAPTVENLTAKEREDRVTEVYRKGLLVVHPDKASEGPLDRDAVTRAFTELYDAAMGR
jgi:hypothetical protein